jgi:hypothetical protein
MNIGLTKYRKAQKKETIKTLIKELLELNMSYFLINQKIIKRVNNVNVSVIIATSKNKTFKNDVVTKATNRDKGICFVVNRERSKIK